jgi:uncharacterized membrane protein
MNYKERTFVFLEEAAMVRIAFPVEIERPVQEVFAYVTDLERLPDWQETTVSVTQETDGPMRAGTRLREVRRGPFGRRVESLVEVSRYEPDRAFDLRIVDGPLAIDGAHRFSGANGHTRIDFEASGELPRALRPATPLVARLMRRQFGAYYRRLKENLEGGAFPPEG